MRLFEVKQDGKWVMVTLRDAETGEEVEVMLTPEEAEYFSERLADVSERVSDKYKILGISSSNDERMGFL
jgi:hypothetical protein